MERLDGPSLQLQVPSLCWKKRQTERAVLANTRRPPFPNSIRLQTSSLLKELKERSFFASYLFFQVVILFPAPSAPQTGAMSGQRRAKTEMGLGSVGASGSSGGGGSLHGLKFGKKVHFEDLGGGGGCGVDHGGSSSRVPASSSGTPTSALAPVSSAAASRGQAATAVAPRRGKGVVQGGQLTPRCQVEGCRVDLTGAKAYYCRHKVCAMHSKAPKVVVAGLEQRFCQQCSRFHQLTEFDQGKRSCRRRLAGHNERRRKPPPGSIPSRYRQLPSSFHEDNNRYGGFFMNFSHPRLSETARDIWLTGRADDRDRGASCQCQDALYTSSSGIVPNMTQPYMQGSTGGSIFPSPKLPLGSSFGVSSSSCALSLLSTEPRDATTTPRDRPYEGLPLGQPGAPAGFTRSTWSFHGTTSSTLEIPREMGLGQAAVQDDGRFSSELELAHQGNKQCMDSGHEQEDGPGNPLR